MLLKCHEDSPQPETFNVDNIPDTETVSNRKWEEVIEKKKKKKDIHACEWVFYWGKVNLGVQNLIQNIVRNDTNQYNIIQAE